MAASERSQPASLSPCADLRSWLGGVRGGFFGSQLRLSKAETFLHFRLAEFPVPLDTESRCYNRPQLSVDLSTVSSGLYITHQAVAVGGTVDSWLALTKRFTNLMHIGLYLVVPRVKRANYDEK